MPNIAGVVEVLAFTGLTFTGTSILLMDRPWQAYQGCLLVLASAELLLVHQRLERRSVKEPFAQSSPDCREQASFIRQSDQAPSSSPYLRQAQLVLAEIWGGDPEVRR